eukprot:Platyproteum_vivax@DN6846_c0_g1_i2.p1
MNYLATCFGRGAPRVATKYARCFGTGAKPHLLPTDLKQPGSLTKAQGQIGRVVILQLAGGDFLGGRPHTSPAPLEMKFEKKNRPRRNLNERPVRVGERTIRSKGFATWT